MGFMFPVLFSRDNEFLRRNTRFPVPSISTEKSAFSRPVVDARKVRADWSGRSAPARIVAEEGRWGVGRVSCLWRVLRREVRHSSGHRARSRLIRLTHPPAAGWGANWFNDAKPACTRSNHSISFGRTSLVFCRVLFFFGFFYFFHTF